MTTRRAFFSYFLAFQSAAERLFNKAVPLYDRAAQLFKKTADRRWEALCLNNIGSVYNAKSERDKAIEYHEKALAIRRAVLGEQHADVATSLILSIEIEKINARECVCRRDPPGVSQACSSRNVLAKRFNGVAIGRRRPSKRHQNNSKGR